MGSARPTSREQLLTPVRVMGYQKKYFICDGLRRGTITVSEAMEAHRMSREELLGWYERYQKHGMDGLRRVNRDRRRTR